MKKPGILWAWVWAGLAAGGQAVAAPGESAVAAGGFRVEETEAALTVRAGEKTVLVYHKAVVEPPAGENPLYRRSGFIHPLVSPGGQVLTDDFPVGHVHQHALFNAWTETTFRGEPHDFWNQAKGVGTVEHVAVLDRFEGAEKAGFRVRLRQVSLKHGPALDEVWAVTVQAGEATWVVDVEIEQRCAANAPVTLEKYHYGGFALRGAATWSSEDKEAYRGEMRLMTPETTDRVEANHTRPGWIAVWGPCGEEMAGVAVFDHPWNFRYPQPVRVHPRMPYFVFTPVVPGGFTICPGETYRNRYRLVTFDGEPDRARIEAWAREYGQSGE